MNFIFRTIFSLFLTIFIITGLTASAKEINVSKVLSLTINSTINPATFNYLQYGSAKAIDEGYNLILVKINTPGGLVSTTKDILALIGESKIPYAIWVTPQSGSATSAGAIIASGAHFLFMSPGTNIGAATPITITGGLDKDSDERKKIINDLVALVTSLAKERGRNHELFAKMVSDASSFGAIEAKEKNLINGIVNTSDEILKYISGKTIKIIGEDVLITCDENVNITVLRMSIGQQLLDIFANPSTSYILFLAGAALIYLEFQAAGGLLIAGTLGVIALLLAAIGFQVIPVNIGALGLIILSFILFILEMFITSYGIISLAGIISLVFGSLFLFKTSEPFIHANPALIISSVSAIVLFVGFIGFFMIYGSKKRKKINDHLFSLVGQRAVITKINPTIISNGKTLYTYQVKVSGESWNATSYNKYQENDNVEIIKHDSKKIILEC